MVETVFKTIKSELIWRTSFQSRRQAENAIARYIDGFYNPVRRHSALGYKSPIKFEQDNGSPLMAGKSTPRSGYWSLSARHRKARRSSSVWPTASARARNPGRRCSSI